MTGVHLPPSLLPGHTPDPQLTRPSLTIDRLAALMPAPEVTQGDVQSSTGGALPTRQPNGVAAGAGNLANAAQTTSTRETLSFAARAILDVMGNADSVPMRAASPLLPSAPAAGTAPASAAAMANGLAALVGESGLFYESHLEQWVSGMRPLTSLLAEPQGPLRQPVAPGSQPPANAAPQPSPGPVAMLPYSGPATPPSPQSNPAATLAELTRPVVFPPASTHGAPIPVNAASHDAVAAEVLRANNRIRQSSPGGASPAGTVGDERRAAQASAAAQAYQATAEVSHDGYHIARAQREAAIANWNTPDPTPSSTDTGPPVHPATEGVVRQQLELLATQQFRFAVDAWPGMPVDWEVTRHEGGQQREGAAEGTAQWSTRVRLSLPQLGNVEAVLTLGARGLEARLLTHDDSAAARLVETRDTFRQQLEARGIALLNLQVQTADVADGAAA
jgi:hypothetical protein